MKNYDCVRCKGTKMLCGKSKCPLIQKKRQAKKKSDKIKKDLFAGAPSVFIGRIGYPKVFSGPMIAYSGQPDILDAPEQWGDFNLNELVGMRYDLARGKKGMEVETAPDPSYDLVSLQEVAMSKDPVDTETHFRKKPLLSTNFSDVSPPYGPSGSLSDFKLTENPSVPRKVDKIVSDDDLKAVKGVQELSSNDVPVSKISKIFSVGLLGERQNRKLVPTRWSITATDDIASKEMTKEVRDFKEVNDYMVFSSEKWGNKFFVILFPGKWGFEVIETYVPGNIWVSEDAEPVFKTDFERYDGRTNYADEVTGGYYAARVAVTEKLRDMRRQAGAIVYREITPDYWCPVGVWQVRENVRNAMKEPDFEADTLKQALGHVRKESELGKEWEKKSTLLKDFRSREALLKYIKD